MAQEQTKNFAQSLVATAPSPATSGTSLSVTTAEGTLFPAAAFNAVVCPANAQPTVTNAEIVRVTAGFGTDAWTITRAQESSSARSIVVGDRIFAGVTAKTLADMYDISATNALLAINMALNASKTGVNLPGVFAPQLTIPAVLGNTVWPTANLAYFMRFVPAKDMSITLMCWRLAVLAGSNDAYDIGLYSQSGANLVYITSLGATTGVMNGTTGVKVPAITASLTVGTTYFAAMSYGTIGTTAATLSFVQQASGSTAVAMASMMGTAGPANSSVLTKATAHPLPTGTITTGLTAAETCPLVAVRVS